jgi:hypothetical protein
MARREQPRIAALAELRDFEIVDGEPDPRGWSVVTRDAAHAATVSELIIDTEALKVRYLECRFDDRRTVLVPSVFVRLDEAARLVILDVVDAPTLRELGRNSRLPTTPDEEAALHAAFVNRTTRPAG